MTKDRPSAVRTGVGNVEEAASPDEPVLVDEGPYARAVFRLARESAIIVPRPPADHSTPIITYTGADDFLSTTISSDSRSAAWTPSPSPPPPPSPPQYSDTLDAATMASDDTDLLVSSSFPPCLPILKQASWASKYAEGIAESDLSAPVFRITNPEEVNPASPFIPALSHTAYLTVHNISSNPQSFILYPVAPGFTGNRPRQEDVRYGIYQASRAINPGNGSITFSLPCGPPLNWGTKLNPGTIVMTGSTWRQDTKGAPLFPTDWTVLSPPDLSGSLTQNVCVMTMPNGSEARFLTSDELKAKGFTGPGDLAPGTIAIQTDGTFDVNNEAHPFVGIGALDPHFPDRIVPIITWDAAPHQVYRLKPNMGTWMVESLSNGAAGTIIDPAHIDEPFIVKFNPASSQPVDVYFTDKNLFSLARSK